jgi:hypothetical protein
MLLNSGDLMRATNPLSSLDLQTWIFKQWENQSYKFGLLVPITVSEYVGAVEFFVEMNCFDRWKMKRTVFAEWIMQLRRGQDELRRFRVISVEIHQGAVAVIGFLAEKTAQPQIVMERIFDIERLQPLFIESDDLGGERQCVCINGSVHPRLPWRFIQPSVVKARM